MFQKVEGYLWKSGFERLSFELWGGLQMDEVQEAVRRHQTPLELELQAIVDHLMWVLGAGLGSSVRAVLSLKP